MTLLVEYLKDAGFTPAPSPLLINFKTLRLLTTKYKEGARLAIFFL
jgi:hypothetical protein